MKTNKTDWTWELDSLSSSMILLSSLGGALLHQEGLPHGDEMKNSGGGMSPTAPWNLCPLIGDKLFMINVDCSMNMWLVFVCVYVCVYRGTEYVCPIKGKNRYFTHSFKWNTTIPIQSLQKESKGGYINSYEESSLNLRFQSILWR